MKTWADFNIAVTGDMHGEVDTTCPECSHTRRKHPKAHCLSVNIDKQTWVCHHCGWSGGLASGAKRAQEDHWRKPDYRRPAPPPTLDLSAETLAWFRSRGITDAVLQRNHVTEALVWMPQVEAKIQAIRFPYLRAGELINAKYRDADKNFRMEPGAERILYGLDDLRETAVIVEGELDKLACEVAGYPNTVSVPDGAPTPETKNYSGKFSFLEADEERLTAVHRWIIAVDKDPPGQRLEEELARRLGREKCYRVTWPKGSKDANDVLIQHGAATLTKCLDTAEPYPINGVFDPMSLSDRIDQLYTNGLERGVSTGWPVVDAFYTVRPGEFTVLTGIPNSGKSEWLDALLVNLAQTQDWPIALFSPENQPIEDHMARMIEKWAAEPFERRAGHDRMSLATLARGKSWLQERFVWMLPADDQEWTLDWVLATAKILVYRRGIRGLVIDPWNEMEHERPENMTETEYVSRALKKIRQFARAHSVHVWVVAHPTKLPKERDGSYKVPSPYDISGSAHWRNKADNCLAVWRDFRPDSRLVEIHVSKIRFRQIGRVGHTELAYNRVAGTYHEVANANDEIPAMYD